MVDFISSSGTIRSEPIPRWARLLSLLSILNKSFRRTVFIQALRIWTTSSSRSRRRKSTYGADTIKTYRVRVSEPEVKTSDGGETADDMVTQYIAYYRNEDGGIGIYSWVNDIELEDIEDYQARRLPRCTQCGAVKPLETEHIEITEAPAEASAPAGYRLAQSCR